MFENCKKIEDIIEELEDIFGDAVIAYLPNGLPDEESEDLPQ